MPKKTLPRIVAVTADKNPLTLRIRWDGDEESNVDVSGLIATFRVYEPLRRSPKLFRQVRLGEHGTDIVWTDDIDMAADTLWRLAQEQAGVTMSSDAFKQWRERKAYTLDSAARAWAQPAHGRLLRARREADPTHRRARHARARRRFGLLQENGEGRQHRTPLPEHASRACAVIARHHDPPNPIFRVPNSNAPHRSSVAAKQ
jgi:Protein of unknown function (DUF2442)